MAFLSLTLDNIKTQGATSTQNVNNIKSTSALSSPILNFNNDLYTVDDNFENTTPEQIKDKYKERENGLKATANEYVNNMHELASQKSEIANQHIEMINASIKEVTVSLSTLKSELQNEEAKSPQDTNKIAQLKTQVETEENKLKSLKDELLKYEMEKIYWSMIDENYEKDVNNWVNMTTAQLEAECSQALEHCQQNNANTGFVPAEQVAKKGLNYNLDALSKVNAEYNANPTPENKAKLAAQIKTVQTVFDASGDELKELGIYTQISNVMSNIISRLELKL